MKKEWTDAETASALRLRGEGKSDRMIALSLHRTLASVRCKFREITPEKKFELIHQSPYPKYDAPLLMEGDALVLPDPEFPYHHADFINQCLELAQVWGITQCIVAGDVLHFDSLSGWEPPWMSEGDKGVQPSPNVSNELQVARKSLVVLGELFGRVDYVIGNHDGRFLRALNSPLFAEDMGKFLGLAPAWRIAPYYFSNLLSNKVPYQIEHPKSTAKYSAQYLADKFQCHILQGHSHAMSMVPSKSGQWMGWQIGCCCDELRFPYAAQRHSTRDAHLLGAAIVRDGYCTVLTENWTDWKRLAALR